MPEFKADIPVREAAAEVIRVNRNFTARDFRDTKRAEILTRGSGSGICGACANQWAKMGCLIPLTLAQQITDEHRLLHTVIGLICFCLVASSVISATICWIWSLIACTAQKTTAGCGHPADSDRHGGSYRSAPGRACTCPYAAQRIHGHSFGVLDAHRPLQFAAETPFFPGLAHTGELVFPATRGRSASRAGQCFDLAVRVFDDPVLRTGCTKRCRIKQINPCRSTAALPLGAISALTAQGLFACACSVLILIFTSMWMKPGLYRSRDCSGRLPTVGWDLVRAWWLARKGN